MKGEGSKLLNRSNQNNMTRLHIYKGQEIKTSCNYKFWIAFVNGNDILMREQITETMALNRAKAYIDSKYTDKELEEREAAEEDR